MKPSITFQPSLAANQRRWLISRRKTPTPFATKVNSPDVDRSSQRSCRSSGVTQNRASGHNFLRPRCF
jgi:hypothetical protein